MPATVLCGHALVARLDGFAAAYNSMARLLLAPADQELLEGLAAPGQLEAWPMPRDQATSRGLDRLRASNAAPESVTTLERDFERLFIGPNSLLAPPYESVHLTTERLIFDGPTFEVRAAYRSLGLEAPSFNREPDDHIGLEFSFLSLLCSRTLDAAEVGDQLKIESLLELQRSFLGNHLLQWGATCLDLVEANAQTAFYQGVGALGLGVLAHAATW